MSTSKFCSLQPRFSVTVNKVRREGQTLQPQQIVLYMAIKLGRPYHHHFYHKLNEKSQSVYDLE